MKKLYLIYLYFTQYLVLSPIQLIRNMIKKLKIRDMEGGAMSPYPPSKTPLRHASALV